MKKRSIICFWLLLAFVGAVFGQVQQQEKGLAGTWLGVLKFSGVELRLVFRLAQNPDGTWNALLDSPD